MLLLLNLDQELYWAWPRVPVLSLLTTGRKAPAGEFRRAAEQLGKPQGDAFQWKLLDGRRRDGIQRAPLCSRIERFFPPDLRGAVVSQTCLRGGLAHGR